MNKKIYLFLIIIFLPFLMVSGFSSWILAGNRSVVLGPQPITTAVCYNGTSNKQYTRVEKALEMANSGDTVYVIPKTDPIIWKDCEVKSGVTLCLPYFDKKYEDTSRKTSNGSFADDNSTNVRNNKMNCLKISPNVRLINNGTIIVGGILGLGASNQRPVGHTVDDYCEILMDSNSIIENNGRITLFGYIKETAKNNGSKIINNDNSILKEPLVIYDYRGGSYSYACKNSNIMPFSIFDFPNCQVETYFYYGASLTGMVTMYYNNRVTTSEASVIGDDSMTSLFKLSNGYVSMKYTPVNNLYTTVDTGVNIKSISDANVTKIKINADLAFSSMIINLGMDVDTADMHCPFSYKYDIEVNSKTTTISNKTKFLAGSIVTVNENGTCIINQETTFYQNYIPAITTATSNLYPQLGSAKLINNGKLTINSSFGGVVETTRKNAILNTSSTFVSSITTKEALTSKGSSFFASVDVADNHEEKAYAYISNIDTKPSNPSLLSASKRYDSKGDFWKENLSNDIKGVEINPSTGSSSAGAKGTFKLSAVLNPSTGTTSTNIKYAWSFVGSQGSATLSSENESSTTLTTPANSSTDNNVDYTIKLVVTFTNGDGVTDTVEAQGKYTATKKDGECVAAGTLITMADGSQKAVENIVPGDKVLTFNHETGKYSIKPVIFNSHSNLDWQYYNVINLKFNDGTLLRVINEHTMFDTSSNKYIVIKEDNYLDYIGHSFYGGSFDGINYLRKDLVLIDAYITNEYTGIYNPLTYYDMNCFTEGLLTMPGDISSVINIFDYDYDLKYNDESMKDSIEQYGLYTYDDFKEYYAYEVYCSLPFKYLKILVGRGQITFDDIINLVDHHMIINGIDPRPKDYEKS